MRGSIAVVLFLFCALVTGCASYSPPKLVASPDYLPRMESKTVGDLQVSAVVLSAEESEQAFATRLASKGIQPIWLEIENREDQGYILMLNSIDPNYFSPSEAAWISRSFGESGGDEKILYFLEQHIPVRILPKSTNNGFVYTNLDPGGKAFAVILVGERAVRQFEFVQAIPGLKADWMHVDFDNLYKPGEVRDLDLGELRAYVESLPCCVLGGDRATPGDPLNIVIVGDGLHVLVTFVRQGWDMTETTTKGSAWRTVMSSLFGVRYRTSPVSPLYVFDRPQDVAFQNARGSVDERNHLRLWLAPVTFQGNDVWVGQISRDIGIKLSSKTLVTHKIDPIIDEARYYLVVDLAASQSLERIAYTQGVGLSTDESPRYNYTEDPYYTDGLRVVLFLTEDTVALDEIERVDWETPPPMTTYITGSSRGR